MFFSIAETVTFQTQLSIDQIVIRLDEAIENPKNLRWSMGSWNTEKKYQGKVDGHTFYLSKIPEAKNSTFAQAEGMIKPAATYSLIEVKLKMPIYAKIFALFWLGLVTIFIFISFSIGDDNLGTQFKYTPLIMFFVGSLLFFGGYKWNAVELKSDIKEILKAEIV